MNLILDRSESSFEIGQSVLLNLRDRVAALHLFLSSHRYDLRANTAYPQKSIPGIVSQGADPSTHSGQPTRAPTPVPSPNPRRGFSKSCALSFSTKRHRRLIDNTDDTDERLMNPDEPSRNSTLDYGSEYRLRVHTQATYRCEGGASPQLPELARIDDQVLVECQCTR
ncbi:hypothetical protein A7U60_g1960 [Sanghuangporus baumii]|uniref:Uncharacterized protein n=1 Tax=Sanghuangporus baumii TaxID=108892 RepID=A0A9Q5I318_SANBA|nr:hypothetical protein A7U60_g1960 [Sanghuangporus baumii]